MSSRIMIQREWKYKKGFLLQKSHNSPLHTLITDSHQSQFHPLTLTLTHHLLCDIAKLNKSDCNVLKKSYSTIWTRAYFLKLIQA